jgi:probable HAF family extracellular repeat protein
VDGISANGAVVVGSINGQAIRWTANEGFLDLGDLPGSIVDRAMGVSANGDVIVGRSWDDRPHAFRWTRTTGMQELPPLPDSFDMATANGVSGDGSITVGVIGPDHNGQAGMWTPQGAEKLGSLSSTFPHSEATGIASDGSTIVGTTEMLVNGMSGPAAFYWTTETGMVALGNLCGGDYDSDAIGVSSDGSVIVGRSVTSAGNSSGGGAGTEAFRWDARRGMVGLGDLPGAGFNSSALAVSADGSVIVGTSEIDTEPVGPWGDYRHVFGAFIWTEATGMRSLADLLRQDYGLEVPGELGEATGISADGTVIVGNAGSFGWVVQLPEPSSFVLALLSVCASIILIRCRRGVWANTSR